jgi:hypothetical protein
MANVRRRIVVDVYAVININTGFHRMLTNISEPLRIVHPSLQSVYESVA